MPVDSETPVVSPDLSTDQDPVKIRLHRHTQSNVNRLERVLIALKLKSKPLIETKPGIAPESLGRARIDREQVRQNLDQEAS